MPFGLRRAGCPNSCNLLRNHVHTLLWSLRNLWRQHGPNTKLNEFMRWGLLFWAGFLLRTSLTSSETRETQKIEGAQPLSHRCCYRLKMWILASRIGQKTISVAICQHAFQGCHLQRDPLALGADGLSNEGILQNKSWNVIKFNWFILILIFNSAPIWLSHAIELVAAVYTWGCIQAVSDVPSLMHHLRCK